MADKKIMFEFSKHAKAQMKVRGIKKSLVENILANPEQIVTQNDKWIYQSISDDKKYLVRVFINPNKNPKLVITVYKTSKIVKYHEG